MPSLRTLPFLLIPLLALGSAAPAIAVTTVPGEVAAYIANDLIDDLNDFYGPGSEGNGRLFTNTTTTSPGTRVFEFTDDFLAGVVADPPVHRRNEWVSVISIDKAPVGFAIVIVDQVTTLPQLESFTESADFGEVVLALPETASLVRDTARGAWFSLDEEQLTPIVSGTSGVSTPIGVDEYRGVVVAQLKAQLDAEEPTDQYGGLIIAGLILVLIILLLAVEAFLPRWHRRLHGRHEGVAVVDEQPVAEPDEPKTSKPKKPKVVEPEPAPEQEAEPELPPAEVAAAASKARAPRTKPPASN